ncbi:serine/threonine-protein kinase [Nesterenkonia sp. HG001]|uniref:serine/threonine-protein kinase n=1 Tax=Nesterenkonia sp. HG001 TaxID=2983207 RepID=UPI002AC4959A|nr:serine/threonine-protein kinase [Nesterenkonia sp. HG001]MDZ5078700.1 serine/threonine protein kinase [Nesterenkonia sp. HG001]
MGDVFAGRYELVDPLGEGGVGTVWRAWDHRQQAYCAAKVLRQVDATSLLRFIREQSLRLDHPHVLAPTGWAGEDDKVLFTLPIIRGGSVSTLVGDFGPLPPRLVALLLDQLLAALEAIHAEGLVHRDVKPANLLLDATGRQHPQLWLGDFGIAAGIDEPRLTQGPYALGTPGYLAPECLRRGWDPDPRADLYSAGMCAVEMLVGLRPDQDTDAVEALAQAELPHSLPPQLVDVVTRLAAPSLTARTQEAAAARRALAESQLCADQVPMEGILGEVEVFDHVPEFPAGWSARGPVDGRGAGSPAGAAAPSAGPSPAVVSTAMPGRREAPTRPAPQAPVLSAAQPLARPALPRQDPPRQDPPRQDPPRERFTVQGRVRGLGIALGLILLGLLVLVATVWIVLT